MKSVQLKIFLISYITLQVKVFAKIRYHTYAVKETKSTVFVPRVIDKTCLLNPDVGPCRGEIPMYYYNPSERNCSIFKWGGCQGNGNRFDTKTECLESCWSKPDELRVRPKFCKLSFDYGYCFGELKRWYYDHAWKTCKETIYSGCGGNKNNFYGLEQCEAVCRFGIVGMLSESVTQHNFHKVLVINAKGGTSKRGKYQSTNATTKKEVSK